MAWLVFRDLVSGFRALGTARSDHIQGDGTPGVVYWGGAGADEINPGINTSRDPADVTKIYGGVSRFGQHPDNPVEGALGVRRLRDDGDDVLHGGANVNAAGGGGRNTYVHHGNSDPDLPFRVFGFSMETDKLVMARHASDEFRFGFEVVRASGRTFEEDGENYLELRSAMIVGHGRPGDFIRQQATFVTFTDDGRHDPDWAPPVLRVTGVSYRDDVQRMFERHTGDGPDDFIL